MPKRRSSRLDMDRATIQSWINEAAAASITRNITQNFITESVDLTGYLTTAAGDLRYYPRTQIDAMLGAQHGPVTSPLSSINVDASQGIDVDLTHAFNWTGAHDFGSTVDVTGALTADSTLDVVGAADFGATLDITGALTAESTATIDGLLTANADITAGGLRWDNGLGSLWINSGAPDGATTMRVRGFDTSDSVFVIDANAGQSGNLLRIRDSSAADMIIATPGGALRSGNFDRGMAGWSIDGPIGHAEFNNLTARGIWHAAVFSINETQVSNGTLLVTPRSGSVYEDVATTGTGDSLTIKITNSEYANAWRFQEDDILGIKAIGFAPTTGTIPAISGRYAWDISTPQSSSGETLNRMVAWLVVTARGTIEDEYQTYDCDVIFGSPGTIREATAIANYGHSTEGGAYPETWIDRPGHIVITADQSGAPYMAIRTLQDENEPHGADGFHKHVQIGRLNGLNTILQEHTGQESYSVWGFAAGTNLSNADSPHVIISDAGVGFFKTNSTYSYTQGVTTGEIEADGSFAFANDIDDEETGGIRFTSSSGDLTIGNPSGQNVTWDYSAGELIFSAGPLATDATSTNDMIGKSPGLYLSAKQLGHWGGTQWKTHIDSGGNFKFVSTTEDALDGTATGRLEWRASDGALSGYNADGRQWWADADDGKIYAGGGAVALDEDGLTLDAGTGTSGTLPTSINWGDADRAIYGYSYTYGAYEDHGIVIAVQDATTRDVISIAAGDTGELYYAEVEVISTTTEGQINITADEGRITMAADEIVLSGLPTSASGLPSGALYSDSGTIKIV